MITTVIYIALAILALSFLIFIHELGHYFMARRLGMRVETFAIGFGKPIWVFERDGVKWQIGWLPFGGYVKIAGMDSDDDKDPYLIKDGFFGKGPWARIQVAAMGPIVNIAFALLVFVALFLMGGREKSFSEYTAKVGWVDPQSQAFVQGLRPGDEVTKYDGKSFSGSKDHLYAPMTASNELSIEGNRIDPSSHQKVPFHYLVKPYPHPQSLQKGILTSGITQPAFYLIYDRFPGAKENPLPEGSPMEHSGIRYGDRIVWVDGRKVYSLQGLEAVLNDERVLLTVERKGKTQLVRLPTVPIEELRLDPQMKEELKDWQFEASLNAEKLTSLRMIPYNLTPNGVVEERLRFIDPEHEAKAFPKVVYSADEIPLIAGDKIVAVNGQKTTRAFMVLKKLQEKQVPIIVERKSQWKALPFSVADQTFEQEINESDLLALTQAFAEGKHSEQKGDLVLLAPVTPKARENFALSKEKKALAAAEVLKRKKELEALSDPEKRQHALTLLEQSQKQLLLGLPIQDRKVVYNPGPLTLFSTVFSEIWRTLTALFTGSMNPKWLSGPIGIVQVVYGSWLLSLKEVLFWLGAISLNLGVLNLLPIPVLDGGAIMLSIFEGVTGKKIPPKAMEKLIFPFALLLIGFFIYFTYNDLMRLFGM